MRSLGELTLPPQVLCNLLWEQGLPAMAAPQLLLDAYKKQILVEPR